jgi:hypothetical protein
VGQDIHVFATSDKSHHGVEMLKDKIYPGEGQENQPTTSLKFPRSDKGRVELVGFYKTEGLSEKDKAVIIKAVDQDLMHRMNGLIVTGRDEQQKAALKKDFYNLKIPAFECEVTGDPQPKKVMEKGVETFVAEYSYTCKETKTENPKKLD